MSIDTRFRTTAPETMDDFAMEGAVLKDALDKIASINRVLGGNKITLQGIEKLLKIEQKASVIRIVDIGCGNGDMLRAVADYGKENGWNFELLGIDANLFTIEYASKLSYQYSNISYSCQNIFDAEFAELNYDIVLCTLTLHHFSDEQILQLMRLFTSRAAIGIVINDLHRTRIAYRLFQGICVVFRLNSMSRDDGLVSILRGFKKQELISYSKHLNLKNYSIKWRWAFRYEWIIRTT